MNNFVVRLLTGIVYVALITGSIVCNSYTFLALFSLVTVLCLWEFYGLINRGKQTNIRPASGCFGGLLLFVSSYLYASETFSHFVFFPYLIYVAALLIYELYGKQKDPLSHLAYTILGQCYIALPVSLLNMVAFQQNNEGVTYYPLLILALFVFIWINDSGAYLVGILIGKHRLFPRISPKKSWEGFFGGLFFTAAGSLVFAHFEPAIPVYHWIALSLIIVIFGTWGDLVESLIKRTLDVKDSGNSLPGHGGFLDRFDSLLLAIYGLFFYVQLFIQN